MRTPKGTFAWVYLNKPDTKFEEVYRATIYFLDKEDAEFKTFVKTLGTLRKQWAKEIGKTIKSINVPLKVATEKQAKLAEVPVGTPFIEAKTKGVDANGNVKDPVPVFDAKGQKDMSLQVFFGDEGRLELSVAGYDGSGIGTGLKLYLNAAQLLKSNGKGSTSGNTFEVEEAYLIDEDEDTPEIEADASEFEDEEADFGDEEVSEAADEDDEDPTAGIL